MSEENVSAPEAIQEPAAAPQDELKNLKAELNRKMELQNSQLQSLINELKASKSSSSTSSKPISVFDDEQKYAEQIAERTKAEIRAELAAKEQQNSRYQSTINSIVQEYPEVSNATSELMVRAQEIYKDLSDDEKASPVAMRAAVSSAASELGIKPKSKRSVSNNDNFSVSGSSAPKSKPKASDLNPATEAFAQMMGLDLSKPETRERIKSYSKK